MSKAKLEGKILLKKDKFPTDLKKVAGELTGDIIIENDPSAIGYYRAFAGVTKIGLTKAGRSKIKEALEKLTGLAWGVDNHNVFQTISFSKKELIAATKTNPMQQELKMDLKKTQLGIACDKWLAINAKMKRAKAERAAQDQPVLEHMRKEGRDELELDGVVFKRVIKPQSEVLEVKGK